ncbi:MAG: molybdopterin-dependent oxidoreductase [Actinobacteria bacterium]|nr:molybdopterin-dependent oxidoreductase [Actinomycetota bacterium]
MATRTAVRTCPLCEATCGLVLTLEGNRIVGAAGDPDDVFSHGYVCPKGATFGELEHDPDRLTRPLVQVDGRHREATWDEAFAIIAERWTAVVDRHGTEATAVYVGNPNVHNLAGSLYLRPLLKLLRTRNLFSASSVDQLPKHVSSGYLFGDPLAIPVPDIDSTDWLLMLGANPRMSNGSLCTAPDFPGRLDALKARGGKLTVVDPRRSRTARKADEHVFIRPGTDGHLLLAMVAELFAADLVDLGALVNVVDGLEVVEQAVAGWDAEQAAAVTGVEADTIRRLTRELAAADRAAVYGRMGTTTVAFGTATSWLVDVLNILTGNLDRPGGAMWPLPAHAIPSRWRRGGWRTGRWTSRVRGFPEAIGELPVATLVDEIETPGEGQVRALLTVAGNPALSTPDSARLDRALASLELMVCVDIYLNETTRHADVILPAEPSIARSHYDAAFYGLAIRNVANYSPPVVDLDEGQEREWRLLLRLAGAMTGQGPDVDLDAADGFVALGLAGQLTSSEESRVHGRDPEELLAATAPRTGPERLLDLMLRAGPYGDGFGAHPDGLTLATLEQNPHGVDLGALQPRIPDVIRNDGGRIDLAPELLVADVARLRAPAAANGGFLLVGRRHLRSNNSWGHNVPSLRKGRDLCTLHLHPDDATGLGVGDGDEVRLKSAAGEVVAPVEVTDDIMRGVISLPHGYGHDLDGIELSVASVNPGVNVNILADGSVDPVSGNAVLNGVAVTLERVAAPAAV